MDAPLNPLLAVWEAPFGLPPFELVRPEHFKPAFERGMREHRDELQQIALQSEAPTFDNTMARFDASGRLLSRIEALFH
ncbi:MAG TPA: peptidase M3, partial [Burkholderiaceae bacterium]